VGNHVLLELSSPGEAALEDWRGGQWLARVQHVPLRPDGALLGHVSALERHCRDVVAGPHTTMVGNRCLIRTLRGQGPSAARFLDTVMCFHPGLKEGSRLGG